MTTPDSEFEERWSSWLRERNRRGLAVSLWMAISLYPVFGILDYLTAPRAWLWLLLTTRAVVAALTVAMFWVLKSAWFDRQPHRIPAAFEVLISFGISLMTVFMGGLASPYYAGLALVMVATGLLYVWPPAVVITTHSLIVASFVVPNLLLTHTTELLAATSNQFFLVSTAIIVGTGQILTYRVQREQVRNQLIIERTKKNLEDAHEQLKRLDRFKSEFFANITHELKTPLTMMLAPLELMIDGQLGSVTEPQRSTLLSIQKSGVKLLRLIADLLDLSKLEESRLRLRIGEHDLVVHVQTLLAQAEPLAQRKAIDLKFEGDRPSILLWYDLERVERVLVNVLSNATKFTNNGGSVRFSVTDEPDTVRVSVRDTGVGFPEHLAEQLFDRFFQVDMAGTRRLGGAGIGLSLAKELIELHAGEIWAEKNADRGATFSFRLRKGRDHFPTEVLDRRARHSSRVDGNRAGDLGLSEWRLHEHDKFRLIDVDQATEQRIVERDSDEERRAHSVLVVEDTPDVIRVIRLALHHQFRVFAASDGKKGFELAKKHVPTLIITDLMMPEIDGLELTRRLRADPATQHIPILMLTARSEIEDRIASLEVGVNAYLAKPFSVKELLSTVRSAIQNQEATAEVLMTHKLDSLQTLAGGLAHEIRNPLNFVKSALSSIQRDTAKIVDIASKQGKNGDSSELLALCTRTERLFDAASSGVRRIAGTVDLMMRYSREGYTRTMQAHDVYAAVRDVLELVVPSAGFPIQVQTELSGDGHVECVPEELNQALTNIVENAVHAVAADGSGEISVHGHGDDGVVCLTIRDNGVGMSPDVQARIFTAFYTTRDAGRGTGLGLFITWRVLTQLGGSIHVSSEPGAGAEFCLRVPRRQLHTPARVRSTPSLASGLDARETS